jgi:hypothetical protein
MCNDPHMPDNDIVPRRVAPYLRSAAKMALGGLPAAEVGDELAKGMAKALRDFTLPPGIELAHALRDAHMYGFDPAADDLNSRFTRAGRNPLAAAVMSEAEYQLEVRGAEVAASTADAVAADVIVGGIRRFVDGQLWESEPFLDALLSEERPMVAEQRRYQEAVLDHAQLDDLARRAVHQDTSRIRAPESQAPPPSTEEQLHEEIDW